MDSYTLDSGSTSYLWAESAGGGHAQVSYSGHFSYHQRDRLAHRRSSGCARGRAPSRSRFVVDRFTNTRSTSP